jgi:long-chain acyl-CoA synthetase
VNKPAVKDRAVQLGAEDAASGDEPRTLPDLFRMAAAKFDRPDALNYKRDGRWQKISSADMVSRAERIAALLHSFGLRRGDRAAILAPNSPEWTLADAACQFAGIVDVPIYTTLSPSSVGYILRDSGSRALFVENSIQLGRLASEIQDCAELETVIMFTSGEVTPDCGVNVVSLSEAERFELIPPDALASEIRPTDLATLIYTSGTTGEPKGVMLTHANIVSNVLDAGEKYSFAGHDTPLSVLPLSHVFERGAMYLYIYNGMAVHYAESIERVPDNLSEVRPTIFVGVPRIFEKVYAKAKLTAAETGGLRERIFDWAIEVARRFVLESEQGKTPGMALWLEHRVADRLVYRKLREFFGGRLRFCITGGAALSDDIFLIFTGAGIPIMQGYGMTETSPVLTSNNPGAVRLGTVGRPIRNVRIRIAEDGEVEAKGPGVMAGYYNKPEATREAFTDDGWFRTGDIGHIDADGYLSITDRKKDLFKTSGGKYVAPSHIEQMIRSSRFVSQAVLIGNGRKFVSALIIPNFEQLASYVKHKGIDAETPAEMCAHERINDLIRRQIDSATAELARFEKVKKFVLLEKEFTVEAGEMTPTLKLKRRVIDERYRPVIDELYREDL